MKGYELTFELRKRGYTQAKLAKVIGVTHATVNNVIHNRATSHRVASKVAELIGRRIQDLWPGRYEYRPRKRRKAHKKGGASD